MTLSSLIDVHRLFRERDSHKIFDASWFLGDDTRTESKGLLAYQQGHIEGASFFDIDDVACRHSTLPHMLPSIARFSSWAICHGVIRQQSIVVYDVHATMMSAARLWWMLRCFGYDHVFILDGGLSAWKQAGYPVVSGDMEERAMRHRHVTSHQDRGGDTSGDVGVMKALAEDRRGRYRATLDDVRQALDNPRVQLVDGRPRQRFLGREREPRPHLACGHIPHSINLPFTELTDTEGCLHQPSTLAALLDSVGGDIHRETITSCGSGITACLLAFVFHMLGNDSVRVYDGSWAEWGDVCRDNIWTGDMRGV